MDQGHCHCLTGMGFPDDVVVPKDATAYCISYKGSIHDTTRTYWRGDVLVLSSRTGALFREEQG